MKLTAQAIKAINTPSVRRELSGLLQCTEQTIIRYIHANKENGPLTVMAVILIVKRVTSLDNNDILDNLKE